MSLFNKQSVRLRAGLLSIILILVVSQNLQAEEPITVQLKTTAGEYYEALKSFEALPKRKRTAQSYISAGRAAWALSLHEQADQHFEQALTFPNLNETDKARTYLAKAIIAHQQQHHQMAVLSAQKAISLLTEASPLRAKVWLLIGQAKISLKEYSQALSSLQSALDESGIEDEGEARYQLGKVSFMLAKFDQAEEHLKSVPYGHSRTAQSMRDLAEVYIQLGKPEKAKFWIEKGKKEFPDYFIDSWSSYALLQAAISENNFSEARTIRNDVNRAYPLSDYWVTMINASTEIAEFKSRRASKLGESL